MEHPPAADGPEITPPPPVADGVAPPESLGAGATPDDAERKEPTADAPPAEQTAADTQDPTSVDNAAAGAVGAQGGLKNGAADTDGAIGIPDNGPAPFDDAVSIPKTAISMETTPADAPPAAPASDALADNGAAATDTTAAAMAIAEDDVKPPTNDVMESLGEKYGMAGTAAQMSNSGAAPHEATDTPQDTGPDTVDAANMVAELNAIKTDDAPVADAEAAPVAMTEVDATVEPQVEQALAESEVPVVNAPANLTGQPEDTGAAPPDTYTAAHAPVDAAAAPEDTNSANDTTSAPTDKTTVDTDAPADGADATAPADTLAPADTAADGADNSTAVAVSAPEEPPAKGAVGDNTLKRAVDKAAAGAEAAAAVAGATAPVEESSPDSSPIAAAGMTKGAGNGSMKVREYLDSTVMPAIRDGMRAMVRAKPDDPHQWLADYLVAHKPAN